MSQAGVQTGGRVGHLDAPPPECRALHTRVGQCRETPTDDGPPPPVGQKAAGSFSYPTSCLEVSDDGLMPQEDPVGGNAGRDQRPPLHGANEERVVRRICLRQYNQ